MESQEIRLVHIRAGANDRTVFDTDTVQNLAANIGDRGLDNPITLRPDPAYRKAYPEHLDGWGDDGNCLGCENPPDVCMCTHYEICSGETRFRAVQKLKWTHISAFVRMLDDEAASLNMLTENMQRRDLDAVDQCFAFVKRMEQFKWDEATLAKKTGLSPKLIARRLKLRSLREDFLGLVRSGQLPVGHAECMAKLDHNRQLIAARPLVEGGRRAINFRDFEKIVERLYEEQISVSMFDLALWGGELEKAPQVKSKQVKLPRVRKDLPEVEVSAETPHHTGAILYQYYLTLKKKGHKTEAEGVLEALRGLSNMNYVRLPHLISIG